MKQNINWGIIGLGNIALKFAQAFKDVDNAKLLGIASKNIQKLENFRQLFKIENQFCFNEYNNLLDCKHIDAIYIALPNALHHEWIIKCIEKKKNILVEKPATLNFAEIVNIQKKLINKKIFFAEGFMYRHHPQMIKLIELMKKKIIGMPLSMESSFGVNLVTKKNFFGFKKKKKINETNRIYNKELGGGAILDLGCYTTSISILIASLIKDIDYNEIKIVKKRKEIGPTKVDIDSFAELRFDNEFSSFVSASFTKDLGKMTKIIGTEGELIIQNSWDANIGIMKVKEKKEYTININLKKNIFSYEIQNISESIINNKVEAEYPAMTLSDTLLNAKILDDWLNDKK